MFKKEEKGSRGDAFSGTARWVGGVRFGKISATEGVLCLKMRCPKWGCGGGRCSGPEPWGDAQPGHGSESSPAALWPGFHGEEDVEELLAHLLSCVDLE